MKRGVKPHFLRHLPSLIFPLSNDGYFLQEVFFFNTFFNIFMFEIVNIFFNIFFNTIFASFNIYSYICIVKIFN